MKKIHKTHIQTRTSPRYSPSFLANYFKGKSARKILQRFPELRSYKSRYGRLWSRSYFVATVGKVGIDVIKRYIEEQSRIEGVVE